MTYSRKTRCAVVRCPHCSWVMTFFGADRFELKLRTALEQVFHVMTMRKAKRGGVR